jgi:cytosine/creatinine deaminase
MDMLKKECHLSINNVYINNFSEVVDIAIRDGKILEIGQNLNYQADHKFDGMGCLASTAFIDPHTHLDKAFIQPEINQSGTLEEAIKIIQHSAKNTIGEKFDERVDKAISWALKHGTLFIRTHIDVNNVNGTSIIEMMKKVKERWYGIVDIQIVAFPQDGLIKYPEIKEFIRQSIEIGADLVGGIPALEDTPLSARKHIDFIFKIAEEFNIDVDMHIDETDDPNSCTLEMLADETINAGWEGRVTAAHCCALAAYHDEYAWKVIDKVAKANISIITNPMVNLVMQGRNDPQPVRRGITRVKELIAAGVNVSCGNDNLRDVFFPFGKFDMLEVAYITSLTAQMTGSNEIDYVLNMPRNNAAKILGLTLYGLCEGCNADMVLIPAKSPKDLLASKSPRKAVIREGKIICESEEVVRMTPLPGLSYN